MDARRVALRVVCMVLAAGAILWAASSLSVVYVGGDSMAPSLCRGDLVVLRHSADGIQSGHVVLVDKEGWPHGVLHRVVEVRFDGHLILRGDANPVSDRDPYPVSAVRGRALLVVPTGRMLSGVQAFAGRWYNHGLTSRT